MRPLARDDCRFQFFYLLPPSRADRGFILSYYIIMQAGLRERSIDVNSSRRGVDWRGKIEKKNWQKKTLSSALAGQVARSGGPLKSRRGYKLLADSSHGTRRANKTRTRKRQKSERIDVQCALVLPGACGGDGSETDGSLIRPFSFCIAHESF